MQHEQKQTLVLKKDKSVQEWDARKV